jgi:pilus assembly protein Flp/PilA
MASGLFYSIETRSQQRAARQSTGASPMKNLVSRFLKDNSGATAIEYGLIAAGISIAIIAVVGTIGSNLNTVFTNVSSQLK